jgi:hypothetical protein
MKAARGIAAAALLLVLAGCQPDQPAADQKVGALRLGTVDVMRVMEEKPETAQIRLDWAAQAGDTYARLGDVKDKAEYDKLQQEIKKSNQEWQKRMDAFMEKSIAQVEVEAEKLAREKGIDLVVVDNPMTKTLRYHNGEDLTTDILLRLQSGGK